MPVPGAYLDKAAQPPKKPVVAPYKPMATMAPGAYGAGGSPLGTPAPGGLASAAPKPQLPGGAATPGTRPPAPLPTSPAPTGGLTPGPLGAPMPVLTQGAPPVGSDIAHGPIGSIPPAPAPGTFTADQNLINHQIDPTQAGLPDRTALAKQAFADYLSSAGDQFKQNERSITQRAAAGGRLGSGMYGSDLTDLATATQRDVLREGNRLASGLAGDTINDARSNRNELRGERGYQYGLSQDAISNAERQRLIEEQLQNGQFGRDQQQLDELIKLGYLNDPNALALGASGQVNANANNASSSVNDLFYQWLLSQKKGG